MYSDFNLNLCKKHPKMTQYRGKTVITDSDKRMKEIKKGKKENKKGMSWFSVVADIHRL